MFTILQTEEFDNWLANLADERGKARISARIISAEFGNFGDCKPVGGGVFEMRVDFGPGYRIYHMRRAMVVYLLLLGGDKKSQKGDIRRAKLLASSIGRSLK